MITAPMAAQRLAADPQVSAWVMASAGTGKTKVLTDRILNLLLAGYAPERILCLTFTKAAAAEMANRLTNRLSRWAILDEDSLDSELTVFLGKNATPDHCQRARHLFTLVLDTPGGMKIQTIHAFCQSILRRFPLEAGVPAQFQVMDELQGETLIHEAQQHVLEKGDDLADMLRILTPLMTEGGFSRLLTILKNDRPKLNALLATYGSIEAYAVDLQQRLEFDPTWVWQDATLIDRLKNSVIPNYDGLKYDYLTLKGEIRKKLPDESHALATQIQAMEDILARVEAGQKTLAVLTMAHRVLDRYQALKEARCCLDYDDLIAKTQDLLTQPSVASWVLYKLDGGIDHLLVDEAQDTNTPQWGIIQSLTTEFFTPEKPYRTVFVVGDAKQSIYSFQGANPQDFMKLRSHFREQARGIGQTWRDISLSVSFRSTPSVLRLVDSVFASTTEGLVFQGEEVAHQAFRDHHVGHVELWPLICPQSSPKETPSPQWTLPRNRSVQPSPKSLLATQIAEHIKEWLESGQHLPSTKAPVQPGDILILVRRRSDFVNHLVRALKHRHIPVSGADRFILTDHIAVQDLLALGRFLLLPSDDLSLACVLKSPLCGVSEEELFDLTHNRPGSLWEAVLKAGKGEELKAMLSHVDYKAPYELYSWILGSLGGRQRFLARLGSDVLDVLEEFLMQALQFDQVNPPSLQLFLGYMDAHDLEIKRDTSDTKDNQVRLMTVHGSKGLQAPIVILPDTTALPSALGNPFLWGEDLVLCRPTQAHDFPLSLRLKEAKRKEEMEEYNRLLYVALTRAEDRLYVAGMGVEEKIPEASWYRVIRRALTALEPSEDRGVLRFPNLPQDPPAPPLETQESSMISLPSWAKVPLEKEADKPLPPKDPVRDEAAMTRGILIHRLLEVLSEVAPLERSAAAQRLVPTLPPEDRERVLRLLSDPDHARFFDSQSFAEVPISGILEGKGIQGRIDRLCVSETEISILDYKSGKSPPSSLGVPSSYKEQLRQYAHVIQGIYPHARIRTYLLWTDTLTLMEI